MRLTLNSLQTEMHSSFNELSLRIHNLDINVNERIDCILLRLDNHIKETAHNFRSVDERFSKIEQKIDSVPGEVAQALAPYFNCIDDILSRHENRITTLEQKH